MRLFHVASSIFLFPLLLTSLAAQENLPAPPAPPPASGPEAGKKADPGLDTGTLQAALAATGPAVVRIQLVEEAGHEGRMRKNMGAGSGAIISPEGHILTNHHVAGRATRFLVTLASREVVDATLVASDSLSDLAVIKLDLASRIDPKLPLPVARFGDVSRLKVGDRVLAIGSPYGSSQTVSQGIIANTSLILPEIYKDFLEMEGENIGEFVRWIEHDANIAPGCSGGPLLNQAGEIIGVNEVGLANFGGAIPADLAQKVAAELIAKGNVTRSWSGMELQPLLRGMREAKGALVSGVLPGSPAAKAGIQSGDTVTEIDGQATGDSRSPEDIPPINSRVMDIPVGKEVNVKGTRDGKPYEWKMVTVQREPNEAREQELKGWGLTMRDFTRVSALEHKREDTKGAYVDTLRGGGPAAVSKPAMQAGDVITKVNDKIINNLEDLQKWTAEFTKEATEQKPAVVTFERGKEQFVAVLRVGPDAVKDQTPRAEKAWLGVETQVLARDLAEALGLSGKKGVRITRVVSGSPGEKAGLKTGDVLLKVDGKVINASRMEDSALFNNLISQYQADGKIGIALLRDGQEITVEAALSAQPKADDEVTRHKDEHFEFTATDLTEKKRVDMGLEGVRGVWVESVIDSGWASVAGLRNSDVIEAIDEERMDDCARLKERLAIMSEKKPRRTTFLIRRGIHHLYLEVEPRW